MKRLTALLTCLALCWSLGAARAEEVQSPAPWVEPYWADAWALGLTEGEGAWDAPVTPGELDRLASAVLDQLCRMTGTPATALAEGAQGNTRAEVLGMFDLALQHCALAREGDLIGEFQRLGVLRGYDGSWGLERVCSRQEAMVLATRLVLAECDRLNAGARGYLWRVGSGEQTFYLLGTMPGKQERDYPLHRVLREAVAGAGCILWEEQGAVTALSPRELYAAMSAEEVALEDAWTWRTGDASALSALEQDPVEVEQAVAWTVACLGQEWGRSYLLAAPAGDLPEIVSRLSDMGYIVEQVTDYQATEPAPSPTPTFDIDLTFAGDCTLASFKGEYKALNFKGIYRTYGPDHFFREVKPIFEADDFTVVNLENVFTDQPLPERYKGTGTAFWFKAPTETTQVLTRGAVEVVSLANNHTLDYGQRGKSDTRAALDQAGVLWGDEDKTLYLEKNGYRLALICTGLWDSSDVAPIVRRIQEASAQSDFQMVFFHGGKEGIYTPEQWKVNACHRLVDAGADLVLGNHPHVPQPREVYNGVDIIYSMANFCFGGNNYPKNRTILYQLKLTVDANGTLTDKTGTIIPCYVFTGPDRNNYQPAPIQDPEQRQRVLDFMDWKRSSPF